MHSGALKHCTDAVVVRAASGHFWVSRVQLNLCHNQPTPLLFLKS
jgi:hypothetical protein